MWLLLGYLKILIMSNAHSLAPERRILISSCCLPAMWSLAPSFKEVLSQRVFEEGCGSERAGLLSTNKSVIASQTQSLVWASSPLLSLGRRCEGSTTRHCWGCSQPPTAALHGMTWSRLLSAFLSRPTPLGNVSSSTGLWKLFSSSIKLRICLSWGICLRLKVL